MFREGCRACGTPRLQRPILTADVRDCLTCTWSIRPSRFRGPSSSPQAGHEQVTLPHAAPARFLPKALAERWFATSLRVGC